MCGGGGRSLIKKEVKVFSPEFNFCTVKHRESVGERKRDTERQRERERQRAERVKFTLWLADLFRAASTAACAVCVLGMEAHEMLADSMRDGSSNGDRSNSDNNYNN